MDMFNFPYTSIFNITYHLCHQCNNLVAMNSKYFSQDELVLNMHMYALIMEFMISNGCENINRLSP